MPDLTKLFEKAEKNLQKQKLGAALEAYLEIYKYNPNDEQVLVNLGDLCLKLNQVAEGLRFQSQLADHYIKRNDTQKAVATCRKILKVFPQEVNVLTKLATLLERSGKNTEALEAYRGALDLHRKSSASQPAIECLQHIVKLDPESLEAHVQLGELTARARQLKVATGAFLRAAQLARQTGQEGRWAELAERAHALDPGDEVGCIAAAEVFLKTGRAANVIPLLEPIVAGKPGDRTPSGLLARAYLETGDYEKAEPLCWQLYQEQPEAIELPTKLIEGLLRKGLAPKALALVERMKGQLLKQGKQNEFLRVTEKVFEADDSNPVVLEALARLYDEMNKEEGLRRTLTRLFNLYVAGEQYEIAAGTLERIIDVEPYGQGHEDRLLSLEGHIDATLYHNILSRIPAASGAPTGANAAAEEATDSLEELLVDGEMYLQYQLTSKLRETLEKIDRLFPGAQERNKRLRELYEEGGFTPTPPPTPAPAVAVSVPKASAESGQSLEDLRKISDITAHIHRESTPQGVMRVAVNELGRALNASRCWGALGTADQPPGLTVEYCSPATASSDPTEAHELYENLMHQALTRPEGWSMDDAAAAFAPARAAIQKLGIKSLLALPFMDREQPAGLLLVEQCEASRSWMSGESLLLKAVATQVVVAVNNTKLHRLVRSLAGPDEETGLLPRSSYIDCLLAESRRAKESSQPLSVCLLEPENPGALAKSLGEAGVRQYFQLVSKTMLANLRQSDISIRYNPYSLAVIFPDTPLPQCGVAVEKIRRALSELKTNGATTPNFCAAVCDVQLGSNFDAVDGVTEVINRLEGALDQLRKEGGKRVLISKFQG